MRYEEISGFVVSLVESSVKQPGQKISQHYFLAQTTRHLGPPAREKTTAIAGKPGDRGTDSNPPLRAWRPARTARRDGTCGVRPALSKNFGHPSLSSETSIISFPLDFL